MKIFSIRADYCELNIVPEILKSAESALASGDIVCFQGVDFDEYNTLELFLEAYCCIQKIKLREANSKIERDYVARFKELLK